MHRLLLLSWMLVAACAAPPPAPLPALSLPDLDGERHVLLRPAPGEVQVLLFTSHECPIANAYAPTVRRLVADWRAEPRVHFRLIQCDPGLSNDDARRHAADYELPAPILLDPRQRAARATEATTTPEAVVVTPDGIVYRGRIDDRWSGLGQRMATASRHDLADAVQAALAGRSVPRPWPQAIGCRLPEPLP